MFVHCDFRHPKEAIASLEMQTMDARIKVWHQSTNFLITVKALRASDYCQKLSAYPVVLGNEVFACPISFPFLFRSCCSAAFTCLTSWFSFTFAIFVTHAGDNFATLLNDRALSTKLCRGRLRDSAK